jgi:regulator of sigma E protease
MHILKILFIVVEVLVLFNVLIFVHELGHFLAARWRGLKIERFAIWFGKPIWKTEINGIEYALGTIPAGGYVSLPQMAPMEAIEGRSDKPHEELPQISALDKIIVAFAGPLFSFGLAIVFAVLVWMVGRPVSESETTTVIGDVDRNSPAEKAGLRAGDRILEVDGKPVTKFGGMGASVTWRVVRSEGTSIPIKVQRGGEVLEFHPVPIKESTKAWQRKSLRQILISPAHTPVISDVVSNSPASRVGLKRFDEVLEVNGTKLFHPAGLGDYIEKHPGEKLTLRGLRANKPFEVTLQPEIPVGVTNGRARIGIQWDTSGGKMAIAHPGVIEQVRGSVDAMISTFGALFSPKSDIKPQHLSGAVKILNIYYVLFESEQGWRLALWFSVIMNVNLALLNLLPIPVLDGGHITLAIVEGIRRKPVSARLLNIVQTSCAAVLIAYMLYVTFYDVQDLPWSRQKDRTPAEMKFTPKSEPAPLPPK